MTHADVEATQMIVQTPARRTDAPLWAIACIVWGGALAVSCAVCLVLIKL